MKHSKKAFTLVELMVMVIILMIVWAISFVKYSQYVKNGQDFKRISDIAQIKMQLETYRKKHAWILPLVDDWNKVAIKNGALTVANQWGLTSTIAGEIWLQKHLLDPELGIPYIYSVTNDKLHYQLATTIMNPEESSASIATYAGLQDPKAYVEGNYTPEWTAENALAIPGLIYAVGKLSSWVQKTTEDGVDIYSLDISQAANKAKVVLNWQTQNLVYNEDGDKMIATGTDYANVASESDFLFKKTN